MDFLTLANNRYSCRNFKEEQISDTQINKILEAARLAPTAVNKQPFHIWVVKSNENLNKVRECTRFGFNAPTIFVVGCKKEEAWVRKYDNENFAIVDGSIVCTHMMMEIEDLDLGTTWVGHFDAPLLKEKFPEMKDYELIALFPVGYKDDKPSKMHNIRKDIKELSSEL